MIKLIRGECPAELTDEVKKALTLLYKQNKEKDVWNSSKIKLPLKKALVDMSYGKCVFCECMLGIESKDITIDHFRPKTNNADIVVEWNNLFPACLRCNREKSDYEGRIINPCEDEPKQYLGVSNIQRYRLKGIDAAGIGKNTINRVNLNDIDRVMVPRMQEWERIHSQLEDIYEDLQEEGYKLKYLKRFEKIMNQCTIKNSYAAIKATNILNDDCYKAVKAVLQEQNVWVHKHIQIEEEIKKIALKLV